MHGSQIELEDCDATVVPQLTDAAATRVAAYHEAFNVKCGGPLMGDRFAGVFTGTFVPRKVRLFGWSRARVIPIFVIRDIDTQGLNLAKLDCPF